MYEGGGKTDDIEIAKIILQQLGGQGRLVVMTGAYNFVALRNGVSFKIKNRSVNYVEIKLNGKDLYDVKFGRIAVGKLKVKSEHNDVYFDELIPLFEKQTGMYLRLFKKGGFVSTQNRDMVLGQLKSIHHHEEELRNALKTSGEIEAWVLAKVQRATTDLSDVTHYIDGRKEFAKGGGVENLKVGDRVYGYFIYNYMGYQLVDYRMGGDLTYGEIKDVITENNQKKYVIKFENGETKKVSVGIFKEYLFVDKKYAKGGMVDLFEDYQKIPPNVQKILDYYSESFEDGSYEGLTKAHKELDKIGYTFEFYLDGQAYGLRRSNVPLNKLKGYEEFAKGGMTEDDALQSLLFENGGMPQEISVADANPYIATAKAVQGIAPQSVSALDQRIARKLNPDPNRPVFFKKGGKTSC